MKLYGMKFQLIVKKLFDAEVFYSFVALLDDINQTQQHSM